MPDIEVRTCAGEAAGQVGLDDSVFGVEVREDLVHAAVVAQLAAKRTGTHRAKTRGEVVGGGRKPYRQKGTGRARHGSIVSPLWRGGGVIFAPRPRDYSHRLPRKVRRRALLSAWSHHAANGSLVVVDALELDELKTHCAHDALEALLEPLADAVAAAVASPLSAADEEVEQAEDHDEEPADGRPVRRAKQRQHVLVLLGPGEAEVRRAFRNLAKVRFDYEEKVSVEYVVELGTAPYASVYDLVLADAVVASRGAVARITAEFTGGSAAVEAAGEEDEA